MPTFRALVAADLPSLSSIYIPYTGATTAVDLNTKTLTNISRLGINSTAVPDILLRAYGDNNSTSRISIRGYSSDANSSSMRVAKFRGTFASPQAPQNGDSLGKFELAGYGTTSSTGYPQASYEGVATENWGATARGAKAVFKVTLNTTTTQVTALTLDQDKSATFASSVTATSFSGSGAGLTSIPNSALTNSTISGVALGGSLYNLTAGTGVSFSAGTTYNGSAAITINATGSGGTVTSVAALTLGTTGTDLSSTVANSTTTPVITLNVPTASATNRGALSAADWSTFNGKQAALVSGTNIKTVGGVSLLGSGDIGTIGATYGGTGQSSYAVGDILYASTTTALSKLADVATGNALISGGVGVAPSYGKIGLTTHISGTLAVGNGGTGLTTLTANYIPYGNGSSAFSSSANFTYDGSVVNIGGSGGGNTLNLWGTNGVGLRIANTSTGNSAYITSNASDVLNIQSNSGSINFLISGGVSKIYAKGSNGYVGINNSSPTSQLDVVGNGNFTTSLYAGTTLTYGTTVFAAGADANTLTTCGAYAGYSISNGPSTFPNPAAWILIEVFNTGNNIIWQRCTDAPYGSNAVKNRGSANGGATWYAWV